jgi:hypothetical protein
MQDDRFKDAGQFHPEKAWSEIRRKDWERKHEAGSRGGGRVAIYLAAGLILLLGGLAVFFFRIPQLLSNLL